MAWAAKLARPQPRDAGPQGSRPLSSARAPLAERRKAAVPPMPGRGLVLRSAASVILALLSAPLAVLGAQAPGLLQRAAGLSRPPAELLSGLGALE